LQPFRPSVDKVLGANLPIDGNDPLYDRDDVHAVFERWREVLNEYDPPRSAVAEAWVPRQRRLLYARPTDLGQALNFDLLLAGWDPRELHDVITSNLNDAAATGASST
jgi:alpha-glucosidase